MSRLVLIFFFLQMSFLSALMVNENFNIEDLKDKKVGYYIGSFDPIHLGHQHVVEASLDYVDYVLIYPVPGGDSFKNRSEHSLRQEMIASVYQKHPKVLLTEWTPKELQDKLGQVTEFVGIVGSDFIEEKIFGPDKVISEKYRKVFMRGIPLTEKHYEDTVGALMALKADSFLVSLRGDVDLSYLNGWVEDRPIRAFIHSNDISSTEVRKAILEKRAFEHLVAFSVQAIIKEKGLYGFLSQFNSILQNELLERVEEDQALREKWIDGDIQWEEVAKIDEKNEIRLKEIVRQYGWPGVSLVGLEGTSAMWLLTQHLFDLEFQKECLVLLKQAVEVYESPMKNYAYLLDRVNMYQGIPQVYGTQWEYENGKYTLYLVENREGLEARRAEIGLGTMEEYKEKMKEAYHLTDEDFAADEK